MRREIYILIALITIITGCNIGSGNKQGDTNFAVEVKFNDFKSDTIIALYEREFESIIHDTIIAKNGVFKIKGYASETQPLYIKDTKNNPLTTVIAYNNLDIKLSGEVANNNITITGDSINAKLAEFNRVNNTKIERLNTLQSSYYTQHSDTSYLNSLKIARNNLINEATKFIKSNRDNVASLYVLYQYVAGGAEGRDITLNLLSEISPSIKDGIMVARIEQYTTKPRYYVGRVMPYTQMHDKNDSTIFSFQRYNKPTVLLFWQPNDSLSNNGLKLMDSLNLEYKATDITLHSIAVTPNKREWLKGIKHHHKRIVNSIIYDGWNSAPIRNLQLNSLPAIIFINSSNVILGRDLTPDSLRTLIDIEVEKIIKKRAKKR